MAGLQAGAPTPSAITVHSQSRQLQVGFSDGSDFHIPFELMRVYSPSAEVQGHGAGQKTTPAGKQDILISSIEPVGNYAIRLGFSDGHDTGLFSWGLLYDYALRQDQLMEDYLARLASDGARRS